MKKKVKDLSLAEMIKYCEKLDYNCNDCLFRIYVEDPCHIRAVWDECGDDEIEVDEHD